MALSDDLLWFNRAKTEVCSTVDSPRTDSQDL